MRQTQPWAWRAPAIGLFFTVAVCSCGSESSRGLSAGAAKVVITPAVETFEDQNADGVWNPGEPLDDLNGNGVWDPVWMAGFGSKRPARGIHDDLYARILVLASGGRKIGIVSVDWVGLARADVLDLRAEAEAAGLGLDLLVLTSTHDHEGPDTMGLWGESVLKSGRDEVYLAASRSKIVQGLAEAERQRVPVKLVAGAGKTSGLTSDTRLPIVLDERFTALRFDRADGRGAVATVVHWSNHPETVGGDNPLLTADFPASLLARLEQHDPGSVGIFWQGEVGGLMTPLHVVINDENGNPLPADSFEKADRLGVLLAEAALSALDVGADATGGGLAFRDRTLLLPLANQDFALAAQYHIVRMPVFDSQGKEVDPTGGQDLFVRTEISIIDLGGAQIVTVPGELYPESALVGENGETFYQQPQDPGADFQGAPCETPIQALMRDTPYRMVLGLADDELGYLVPKCEFDKDPPYAYGRQEAQYGEDLAVGPETTPLLIGAIGEEIAALAKDTGN